MPPVKCKQPLLVGFGGQRLRTNQLPQRKHSMHISQLKQSRFLTRNDVGRGMLVTIRSISQENVAKEGAPEELRWVVSFDETEKPMVLNSTNGQIIASITKSEETDNWVGHKVVLYDDPNVSFGGKLVGGIRCRAPRNQPAPPPARPATPAPRPAAKPAPAPAESEPPAPEPDADDVPF